jgi:4-hydroxy-3-methylbut-2-enyl diphosphate reductase
VSGSLLVLAPLRLEALAVRGAVPGARVVRTGMGRARAEAAASSLRNGIPAAVAVVGVCGGARDGLRAGDVVIATEVRDGTDSVRTLPGAALLAAAVRRTGQRVVMGPVASTESFAKPGDRGLLAESGVVAVDMESAWLASVANGRPLAVLRVVADEPGRRMADPRLLSDGARALLTLRRAAPALDAWRGAVGTRRVLLASPRSFCAGVDRAIEVVEAALEQRGAPVYVRKQIVHNVHVVSGLEQRGAVFVEELDEVPNGATVVFSAHGVSPAVKEEARRRGLDVIDATCPLVNKVHAEARNFAKAGKTIFLVGHAGHEEVEGTTGEAPDAIRLVETVDDVAAIEIDNPERVAFLTQTTLAVDDTMIVVDEIRRRFPALVGPPSDDICYATQNRQQALMAVADEADVVLVVGSENSSNSKRLVEVSERQGTPAYLVDDASEIDPAWLHGVATVGLTAGASAPDGLVQEIVDELRGLGPVEVEDRTITQETIQFGLPKEVKR